MSLLKLKSLWYPIGTSVQESKLAGLSYFLILRATKIYWNTKKITFHKVFCARCGTYCIDSWYLPSSLLFILTRVPTHKKYRILCYPLRSYSGWLPIRCAYFILGSIPRRAKHAEFEVLSGIPWICLRHFLWNFSKLSISLCLRSNASRSYSSRGMTKIDQMCPPWVALSPPPPCSPAPIKE